MKIELFDTASKALNVNFTNKVVVVIDVLRATSVITTAFANGAKEIYPFMGVEETFEMAKKIDGSLLAGERGGIKIDGFDLGNSPLDFTKEKIFNKTICMTTSNGTRAIENSKTADVIYICSFLNVSSVAKKLLNEDRDIAIICSGTNDEFSLDDSLCAGILLNKLKSKAKLNDFSLSMAKMAQFMPDIKKVLEGTKHYEYLKSLGFTKDLEYCITPDIIDVVPYYKNSKIILDNDT